MTTVMVQVLISEVTKHGTFNDAIYFTEQEYQALNSKEIDQMAQDRIDKFVSMMDNFVPGDPTKAELQAFAADLQKQLADVNDQIAKKG